jgi:hypothetical protein
VGICYPFGSALITINAKAYGGSSLIDTLRLASYPGGVNDSSAVLQRPVNVTCGAPFGAETVSASRQPQPFTPDALSDLYTASLTAKRLAK